MQPFFKYYLDINLLYDNFKLTLEYFYTVNLFLPKISFI